MSVKYIPYGNTKVVINKVVYQNQNGKKALLPVDKIGKGELERLLKEKLIVKLEFDEGGKPSGDKDAAKDGKRNKVKDKPLNEMSNDELKAKAKELGIDPGFFEPEEKLREKILEAQEKK
jgi:hypothetical protein